MSVTQISDWTLSTYVLSSGSKPSPLSIHICHPNELGTNLDKGSAAERARLARSRHRYVSHDMYIAANRPACLPPFAPIIRLTMNKQLRERSRQKTCFRRDEPDVSVLPPLRAPPPPGPGKEVSFYLECAANAANHAEQLYGAAVASDIDLGFSRAFRIDEDAFSELPRVVDAVCEGEVSLEREQALSIVISYRHTVQKSGRILNIRPDDWGPVLDTIKVVCQRAGYSWIRLWTDQILSYRKPAGALRWVSSGILPYMIHPVLFIWRKANAEQRPHILVREDLRRMWISIEHLCASLGQGIIHCGDALGEDELPLEWPTTYISIQSPSRTSPVTWMIGHALPIHLVIRKVCGAIMCGLVRNKQLSWVEDAQDIIDWACSIVSTVSKNDISHSYECEDCKRPSGYTSGHRFSAILSSSVIIDPLGGRIQSTIQENHPRLDVPALKLSLHGRSWDGFREWIPESAIWGNELDQIQSTRKRFLRLTDGLVTSPGGVRAIAILQFRTADGAGEKGYIAAHMLVGLETSRESRYVGKVEWTKRFWPVNPLRMYLCYMRLLRDNGDDEALRELGDIVGASSGLDYRDIARARDVESVVMDRVHWS